MTKFTKCKKVIINHLTIISKPHAHPHTMKKTSANFKKIGKPEDHWSCIAHLTAEDMLKSAAVMEEKKIKHSPWAGADNPLGPKF